MLNRACLKLRPILIKTCRISRWLYRCLVPRSRIGRSSDLNLPSSRLFLPPLQSFSSEALTKPYAPGPGILKLDSILHPAPSEAVKRKLMATALYSFCRSLSSRPAPKDSSTLTFIELEFESARRGCQPVLELLETFLKKQLKCVELDVAIESIGRQSTEKDKAKLFTHREVCDFLEELAILSHIKTKDPLSCTDSLTLLKLYSKKSGL